ncbi:MAG: hypothetical protein JO360_13670 [Acidobacteria bacterium]|nr:hypothetical protein [Acidobacteriota bacterium]
MRKLFLLLAFLFALYGTGYGQYKENELKLLRGILGIRLDTPIAKAESLKLPEDAPLKVFITTNNERQTRTDFIKWIDAWNQADGKKYGTIEVVDDRKQATVILARYGYPNPVQLREEDGGGASTYDIDPATRKPVDNSVFARKPLVARFRLPIYAYVMLNSPDGLKIIRTFTDSVILTSSIAYTSVTPDSSSSTSRVLEPLNTGDMPKGQKDAKVPGDKFRDEFFKMMKARSVK